MSQTIEMIDPVTGEIIDQQQIAEQLLAQAKEQGVSLVGPGGLLGGLTNDEVVVAADASQRVGHGAAGRCPPRHAPQRDLLPAKTSRRSLTDTIGTPPAGFCDLAASQRNSCSTS
ncbi:hypothetical protein [Tessaracoccus flavescens]|uniref:hypothetical protein n=1 Tax=Tessaracoccus flavescens TaxID=399497 RepID=UPI00098472E5|nr:hypothetical protein [Tessaracoccus flavescens]